MRTVKILFVALFMLTLSSCEKTYYCVCQDSNSGIVQSVTEIQAKGTKAATNICKTQQQVNEFCYADNYAP